MINILILTIATIIPKTTPPIASSEYAFPYFTKLFDRALYVLYMTKALYKVEYITLNQKSMY